MKTYAELPEYIRMPEHIRQLRQVQLNEWACRVLDDDPTVSLDDYLLMVDSDWPQSFEHARFVDEQAEYLDKQVHEYLQRPEKEEEPSWWEIEDEIDSRLAETKGAYHEPI